MSEDDRERTAYHEAGHALVGMLTPGADPVRKVSIIPRGHGARRDALAPEADKSSYERGATCSAKIKVALGGRVAEKLVYGEITTGAESDIQQLTADRAQHGRALGDERRDRPGRGAAARTRRARCCPARRRRRERRSG